MARYVSWLANAVLLIICCAVVASTTNTVFAAWLTPEPAAVDRSVSSAPVVTQRSWNDRQVILNRNLFNASLLTPAQAAPVVQEENLEETKLPLALLGTFASADPKIARATVDDQEARMHLVLAVGDEITGGRAKLIRIERRRIVLEENGSLRELTFEDAAAADSTSKATKPRRSRHQSASTRRRASRKPASKPSPSAADLGIRNPADIFSDARILPKWENGRMVGVQVSGIKAGSLFEELGISDGEVITHLNGIAIDSPEASAQVMLELTEATTFEVTIDGEEGTQTRTVPINP
jgi:type II secretion system protein C